MIDASSPVIGIAPFSASSAAEPARSCRVSAVSKSFGAQAILRGVELEIPRGTFAVLVGPSGCGKSTLLRLIAGLEEVDGGTISIGDRDVTALPPRDRDVAMVFQSYALYPHLTVRENLAFGLKLRGLPAAEIAKSIGDAVAILGLDALLERLPKQLSGGQRQRVAMGRAIVRRPALFLFDEPLSNLDAALRAEVRVDIRRLHDRLGATTIYVTHDQVEAMTLADKLWIMNGGVVEQAGAPLDVYDRPRTRFVGTFLGSPQMSLIDAVLRRGGGMVRATAQGLAAPCAASRIGDGEPEGKEVTLGVRPHDLVRARGEETPIAILHVEVVEALGSEAFVHGKIENTETRLVARVEPADAKTLRAGSALGVIVAPERVHLFERATGLALDADR